MDYIKSLQVDLENGYSKADLERLIGLPKNNLSGILKGDRNLSKKSKLKIDKWEASEKPHPLELNFEKELTKALGENAAELLKVKNDMADFGTSVSKIDKDGNFKRVHPLSNEAMVALHNAENKDSHIQTLEYPTDFQSLLKMAKEGVDNPEAFKMAVSASKLAPNQKSMVLAKLK